MLKIGFMGSKPLGLAMLKALHQASPEALWRVIHPDDTPDFRSCLTSFQHYTRDQHLELLVAPTQAAASQMLKDYKPDVVFVCGWYWLLNAEILDIAKHGFWGLHNSLLPRYRGASPLVWSIINGDEYVGGTIFRFTEAMDDGPVLYQGKVALGNHCGIGEILQKLENDLLANVSSRWRAVLEGRAETYEQDHDAATYCGHRKAEDGLINWQQSAAKVHNFIRAQSSPYPGAFTNVGDQRVVIQKSSVDPRRFFGTPGQVLQRGGCLVISCGSHSAIQIHETEIDGRSVSPSEAFPTIAVRLEYFRNKP